MNVGLDLGTTQFRSTRTLQGELIVRQCPATYLAVADSAGHQRLIDNTRAQHATCGTDLIVFGDDAIDCAAMLDLPVTPLLRNGKLPSDDPVARQVLALMIDAVLPPADRRTDVCCLIVPGGYHFEANDIPFDVRFLQQLTTLRGYVPRLISSSQAIVLAELPQASFSGLGISLGAASCEFGVIHCGQELARISIASPLGELADAFSADSTSPSSERHIFSVDSARQAAWEHNCFRLLVSILNEAREKLAESNGIRLLPQSAHVVCAGGITAADGFSKAFEAAWEKAAWPVSAIRIRIASDPTYTIARGALIQAHLENPSTEERSAA